MSNKKRVLYFCGIGTGGIETLVISIIKELKVKDIDFEIYTTDSDSNDASNKKLLEEMGVCISNAGKYNMSSLFSYMYSLYQHLRNNHYTVVHSHNLFSSGINLFIAWLAGVPVRIAHAHNTQTKAKRDIMRRIYEFVMQILMRFFATDLIGVSKEAAEFVFGRGSLSDNRTKIIFNGIDLNKFNSSRYNHNAVYQELKLNPQDIHFVSVARFVIQKNHTFLIDVFCDIMKENPNVHLTLIGDGELKAEIEQYVLGKDINNKVTFTGKRDDVPFVLSAMDYFILPSEWEGFGIVYIEAQAMGLYCFASDCIPKVADAGCISFISLQKEPWQWAHEILEKHKDILEGKKKLSPSLINKFDIKMTVEKIAKLHGEA